MTDAAIRWTKVHFFRLWTAILGLIIYGFFFVKYPEILKWWRRLVNAAVEFGCSLLPYPWGDQLETMVGNVFGFWLQIALFIIAVRIAAWCFAQWRRPAALSGETT